VEERDMLRKFLERKKEIWYVYIVGIHIIVSSEERYGLKIQELL
tara:strand:+ start:183 stop:314 length:132 start_codon:yes stop_codon:yes gene_type:complete